MRAGTLQLRGRNLDVGIKAHLEDHGIYSGGILCVKYYYRYRREDAIGRLLGDVPFLGEAMAALIGLIPNCAPSVIITELYLDGMLSAGAMMSGLLVSAGVGLLVLFRMNRHRLKKTLWSLEPCMLLVCLWGLLINLLGITF